MKKTKISQATLIFEYFESHPDQDVPHQDVVDWATKEYLTRCQQVLRDPDRAIRKMHQNGQLIKVRKGVYRYEPSGVVLRVLEDFDSKTKRLVLERDGFRCIVCGRGERDAVELHVDHVIPKDKGGKATVDNGQTLCAMHNFQKKNYGQVEFGLRMFVRMRVYAVKLKDRDTQAFLDELIEVFKRHGHDATIEGREKK